VIEWQAGGHTMEEYALVGLFALGVIIALLTSLIKKKS
jgi:hypothetical protein